MAPGRAAPEAGRFTPLAVSSGITCSLPVCKGAGAKNGRHVPAANADEIFMFLGECKGQVFPGHAGIVPQVGRKSIAYSMGRMHDTKIAIVRSRKL
jgi:hypothetical protein